MIELKHIVKEFKDNGRDVHAVNDVSITVNDGDIYGIIGFSGAGKSTLVRCINLLGRPNSGEVIIDGTDITRLPARELREARKKIGMIFQHFNLMPSRTVAGNVAYPLKGSGLSKDEINKKVQKLLEMVEISDKAGAYPSQLSGGQKQRVAIARALATNPKVLLCDEATSALDPTTTTSILGLLKDLNRKLGVTIVVITHQMSVIEDICSRVAILDGGIVAEQGPVTDIFSNPSTDAARKLVYPNGYNERQTFITGAKIIRVAFNSYECTYEPLIASLAIDCSVKVSILFADIRNIDGKATGTMILRLPEDADEAQRAVDYIASKEHITYEEVHENV